MTHLIDATIVIVIVVVVAIIHSAAVIHGDAKIIISHGGCT